MIFVHGKSELLYTQKRLFGFSHISGLDYEQRAENSS